MHNSSRIPDKETINLIHQKIKPYIHKTPVLSSQTFNNMFGGNAWFKCENFQKVGAFKMRGAVNAILSLKENEKKRGVVTHSSGNHAQAVALASKIFGIEVKIVMPKNAPLSKVSAVKDYGAEVIFCEPTIVARENTVAELVKEFGVVMIHPFDDYNVIGGQTTVAKELFEEVGHLDYVVAPVGGGGLLSGSILSAKYFGKAKIVGAEPLQVDDAYWSLKKGVRMPATEKNTIADGLKTNVGEKTFPIIKDGVEDIIRVEEHDIVDAMRFLWERMKLVIEPSGAVPVAAVLKEKERFKNKEVGLILTGGNIDLSNLPF